MINELIKHFTKQIELYNKVVSELDLLEKDMCIAFDRKIVHDRKEEIKKLIYDYETDIEIIGESDGNVS